MSAYNGSLGDLMGDADKIDAKAKLEARERGLEVITIVYTAEGQYQVLCTGNVNTIVGLLTRAAVTISNIKAGQK